MGKGNHQAIVTLTERKSRFALLRKVERRTANQVCDALVDLLQPIADRVHTITADNGKEFAEHFGGGAGGYWVSILSRDLGPSKDPVTYQDLRRFVPGFYGTMGVQRPITKLVTGTADVAYHYAFWEDQENFPAGFNGNKAYFQLRLAMIFHFSVSERIETGFPG